MGKSVDKLAVLIKDKFDISLDTSTFERTRSGYYQRSEGAWSWSMQRPNSPIDFGSQYSVGDLIKYWDTVELYGAHELVIEKR